MSLVADVDDAVALAGAHADLVMDLGDEWAHRVDDVATPCSGRFDDGRCRSMGREHDRVPSRDIGDVVDEDHALALEALDDQLVVDDLVVAVHGRLESPDHPGQGLDRHLHPGTEPAGLGEQHPINSHADSGYEQDRPPVAWYSP